MKRIVFILLLFLAFTTGFAQSYLGYGKTKADYERVFGKFMKFYNNGQSDSIYSILSDKWNEENKRSNWNADIIRIIQESIGKIESYKYIDTFRGRIDAYSNPMVYFKLVFNKPAKSHVPSINNKKEHAVCLSLDEEGKILGLNFITSSPAVDSLISKY